MKGLLQEKYDGYSFGISIGRKLDDKIVNGIKEAPTPDYFHHYEDINRQLQAVSENISFDLQEAGIGALALKPTISPNSGEFDPYQKTLRYEISHKMVATRAGLGWIGKTDLFISPVFGARLRLTSILVNKEIGPELKPVDKSKCGNCTVCVEKCPAKAATGQLWDINTDRDLFFDAFKCREKCGELCRIHLKMDRRICGICVAVCPIGRAGKS
jgi:epoxyqueuosine reductase QueG